jgi:hypothetical protein
LKLLPIQGVGKENDMLLNIVFVISILMYIPLNYGMEPTSFWSGEKLLALPEITPHVTQYLSDHDAKLFNLVSKAMLARKDIILNEQRNVAGQKRKVRLLEATASYLESKEDFPMTNAKTAIDALKRGEQYTETIVPQDCICNVTWNNNSDACCFVVLPNTEKEVYFVASMLRPDGLFVHITRNTEPAFRNTSFFINKTTPAVLCYTSATTTLWTTDLKNPEQCWKGQNIDIALGDEHKDITYSLYFLQEYPLLAQYCCAAIYRKNKESKDAKCSLDNVSINGFLLPEDHRKKIQSILLSTDYLGNAGEWDTKKLLSWMAFSYYYCHHTQGISLSNLYMGKQYKDVPEKSKVVYSAALRDGVLRRKAIECYVHNNTKPLEKFLEQIRMITFRNGLQASRFPDALHMSQTPAQNPAYTVVQLSRSTQSRRNPPHPLSLFDIHQQPILIPNDYIVVSAAARQNYREQEYARTAEQDVIATHYTHHYLIAFLLRSGNEQHKISLYTAKVFRSLIFLQHILDQGKFHLYTTWEKDIPLDSTIGKRCGPNSLSFDFDTEQLLHVEIEKLDQEPGAKEQFIIDIET